MPQNDISLLIIGIIGIITFLGFILIIWCMHKLTK